MFTSIRFNGFTKTEQSNQFNVTKNQASTNFKVASDIVSFGNAQQMSQLGEFVLTHSKIINPPEGFKNSRIITPPLENIVNLTFFGVEKVGNPSVEIFRKLAQPVKKLIEDAPNKELSYIHLGGEMGDQRIALQTMGLGDLLGEWKVLSPDTMMPNLSKDMKQQMAQLGMVSIIKK